MGHQQKAARIEKNNDRLIELPDEILYKIISMMTLKEAVRTSLLSKSWRFVWTNHPDLLFDYASIHGSKSKNDTQLQRLSTELVNHIMCQRHKGGKIDSLAIRFHLGNESASHINRWIRCAVTHGVEKIDLNLSQRCTSVVDNASRKAELYFFSCSLLASSGKKSTVKHLKLVSCSCSLSCLPTHNSLASLVTVELQCVNISDKQLESFLSSCLLLERLTLHHCNDLVNFKFSGPSIRLKLLTIRNCLRLEHVEIDAESLVTLEHTGQLVGFFFKNVPRLAKMFLSFTGASRLDGLTYALTRVAYDLPQLETLNIVSLLSWRKLKLPERAPTFSSIKQLVLTVIPFHDDEELSWISYILKAFPLLHKLQLNLSTPSFSRKRQEIDRGLPQCIHRHLNELQINGFLGNRHESELLNYLVNNAVGLQALEITTCPKLYKGFKEWLCEVASVGYKLSIEIIEELRDTVPPTVHLDIQ